MGSSELREIRLHGRGGQGVAMAAEMLAAAFVSECKFATAFPMFGFERRGAPVAAFVRVDTRPVAQRTQVYYPDAVLIADPFLKKWPSVFDGLRPKGKLVINASTEPNETLHENIRTVGIVDATAIALEEIGRPITNTCMLGAFARTTQWLTLASVLAILREYFEGALLAKNVKCAERGFAETKVVTR